MAAGHLELELELRELMGAEVVLTGLAAGAAVGGGGAGPCSGRNAAAEGAVGEKDVELGRVADLAETCGARDEDVSEDAEVQGLGQGRVGALARRLTERVNITS